MLDKKFACHEKKEVKNPTQSLSSHWILFITKKSLQLINLVVGLDKIYFMIFAISLKLKVFHRFLERAFS